MNLFIVARTGRGIEVVEYLPDEEENKYLHRQIACRFPDGNKQILHMSAIIRTFEHAADAVNAKLAGEAQERLFRPFWEAALAAEQKARHMMNNLADAAIHEWTKGE